MSFGQSTPSNGRPYHMAIATGTVTSSTFLIITFYLVSREIVKFISVAQSKMPPDHQRAIRTGFEEFQIPLTKALHDNPFLGTAIVQDVPAKCFDE